MLMLLVGMYSFGGLHMGNGGLGSKDKSEERAWYCAWNCFRLRCGTEEARAQRERACSRRSSIQNRVRAYLAAKMSARPWERSVRYGSSAASQTIIDIPSIFKIMHTVSVASDRMLSVTNSGCKTFSSHMFVMAPYAAVTVTLDGTDDDEEEEEDGCIPCER